MLDGDVDIGWNTNTAYVALDHRVGGAHADPRHARRRRGLGDRAGHAQGRVDVSDVPELAGRRLALGSRDSGHAAILPLHYLAERASTPRTSASCCASTPTSASTATPATPSCTSSAPWRPAKPTPARCRTRTSARSAPRACRRSPSLEVVWRSPTYYHCNFTVLDSFDEEVGRAVERGAAGDGLRRSDAAAGDGARERAALAAGRPRGLRRR